MNNKQPIFRGHELRFFIIAVFLLIFFFLASLFFSYNFRAQGSEDLSEAEPRSFPEVELIAKAAYVYDLRTQTVLFAKNEDTRLSLASLTKVMSSLVSLDLSPPYGVVTISGEALQSVGDTGLYKDERWLLRDIIDFSLVTSSNDGMRAVALTLGSLSKTNASTSEILNDFVGVMNLKAGELGLKNTYFLNETGLDESEIKGGAYGSAKDMATLLEHILINYPELLVATKETKATFASLDNHLHLATNTNSIVDEIPGLIASKTGSTNTAGGNLVLVFDPELGRPIIISILGSTANGRFRDAQVLIGAVMEYINNN